jgi:hypothetical protein
MYLFILLLTFSLNLYSSIIPENDLNIAVSRNKNSAMTEIKFNTLIDKVTTPYKDIILNHYGATQFNVFREWENGKVNAAARKVKGKFEMIVYGGLARYEALSDDGLMLVLCHELGHLIGGAPTYKPFNTSSSEGQADYFSTSKCFKKITMNDDNKVIVGNQRVDAAAKSVCDKQYKNASDVYQCYRSSIAQLSLARVMEALGSLKVSLRFDTPEQLRRRLIIFNGYPTAQCRLDTLLAGSLCNKNPSELLEMELYNKGNCTEAAKEVGIRPRCWYVPRLDSL